MKILFALVCFALSFSASFAWAEGEEASKFRCGTYHEKNQHLMCIADPCCYRTVITRFDRGRSIWKCDRVVDSPFCDAGKKSASGKDSDLSGFDESWKNKKEGAGEVCESCVRKAVENYANSLQAQASAIVDAVEADEAEKRLAELKEYNKTLSDDLGAAHARKLEFSQTVLGLDFEPAVAIYIDVSPAMRKRCFAEGNDRTCLDLATAEASRKIQSLQPNQKFNIFVLSKPVKAWMPTMMDGKKSKKGAQQFLREIARNPEKFEPGLSLREAYAQTAKATKSSAALVYGSVGVIGSDPAADALAISELKGEVSNDQGRIHRLMIRPFGYKSTTLEQKRFFDQITMNSTDVVLEPERIRRKKLQVAAEFLQLRTEYELLFDQQAPLLKKREQAKKAKSAVSP